MGRYRFGMGFLRFLCAIAVLGPAETIWKYSLGFWINLMLMLISLLNQPDSYDLFVLLVLLVIMIDAFEIITMSSRLTRPSSLSAQALVCIAGSLAVA